MADLDRAAIAAVDASNMLDDVLDQPAQLRDALQRVRSAGIEPSAEPGGLRIFGMGGSAIGGDLAAAAVGDRARAPIATRRDYAAEPWLGEHTVCLCASYSGHTEETLASYDAAGAAGAKRIALTNGGSLGERARADGVPVIGVPAGFMPRAAVAYMTCSAFAVAHLAGVLEEPPDLEVEAAAKLLEELAGEWGPDAEEDSAAKALARELPGRIPVVYGGDLSAPASRRWKGQFNENGGVHAFWNELPELDHNEIMGWERAQELGAFSAIFLKDSGQDPRIARRVELTAEAIRAAGSPAHVVESRGENPFERVMSLVMLGDLVSIYLSTLIGVDPSPMDIIERLKSQL